jgi:hypothetical protein
VPDLSARVAEIVDALPIRPGLRGGDPLREVDLASDQGA